MDGLSYLGARALAQSGMVGQPGSALQQQVESFHALAPGQRAALETGIEARRFDLLAESYCAGQGQPAAALGLGLAVACALWPQVAAEFQAAERTLDFAAVWQWAMGRTVWQDGDLARRTLAVLRLFLLGHDPEDLHAPLTADQRLLGFLGGGDRIDPLLTEVAAYADPEQDNPVLIREPLVDAVAEALGRARLQGSLLHLSGTEGIGKAYTLAQAAQKQELLVLQVDCRLLGANPVDTIWKMVDSLRREALFYGACVCLRHADQFAARPQPAGRQDPWESRFFHLCVEPLLQQDLLVCVTTDQRTSFLPWAGRPVEQMEFPDCTRTEQIALWQGLAGQAGITLDAVQCGSKYKLTPRQIVLAVRQLAHEGTHPDQSSIARVCGQVLPPPDQGGIRRIRTSYTLEDLKLPPVQKQKLQNIADHVLYRHRVYDEWNMESRFAYGRNVSALFVGPPGTGKTMAVHVLSNMLDLPLYRIDLSQVVDKYIGETEKRLEKIFNTAEQSNVILFFDEADSIFGKRSEVNDAKDKYANTEVSYILQRIEQYDGIVILATNYKRNIDEAFMRRMRYLVEFQLPTQELREQIWRGCFPPQVPLEEVDFPYLARQFELSGGSIKNVALNAVFLAAGQNSPVTMRHLLESLRDENLKMGKPMLAQDFAEYAPLML